MQAWRGPLRKHTDSVCLYLPVHVCVYVCVLDCVRVWGERVCVRPYVSMCVCLTVCACEHVLALGSV